MAEALCWSVPIMLAAIIERYIGFINEVRRG
jgi:hypothetical protein